MEFAIVGKLGHAPAHGGRRLNILGKANDPERDRACRKGIAAIKLEAYLPLINRVLWVAATETGGIGCLDFRPEGVIREGRRRKGINRVMRGRK